MSLTETRAGELDYVENCELISRWGQVVTAEYRWCPRPGETVSVRSGKFATEREAVAEAWQKAVAAGYRVPRWFEWWRWRERNPEPLT